MSGLTLIGLANANASESDTTFVGADGALTTAKATVLGSSNDVSLTLSDTVNEGVYVCKAGTITLAKLTISGAVQLILEDNCDMRITAASGSALNISPGGTNSLVVWGGQANSGKLTARGGSQGAGLFVSSTSNGVRFNGGRVLSFGGDGAAGIGGAYGQASGTVSIRNRANVYASGGKAGVATSAGGGAGIGSGGAPLGSAAPGYAAITVDTEGLVQSFGGSAVGAGGAGAAVGSGGSSSGGSPQAGTMASGIQVKNTTTPTLTGGGLTLHGMGEALFYSLEGFDSVPLTSVVTGSTVTMFFDPGQNHSVYSASFASTPDANNMTQMLEKGLNVYSKKVTTAMPSNIAIYVVFTGSAWLQMSVSPEQSQTRPGVVHLIAKLTSYTGASVSGRRIRFYDGATLLATSGLTDASGVVDVSLGSPAAGTKSYYAAWEGDPQIEKSTSYPIAYEVLLAPQTSLIVLSGLDTSYTYGDGPIRLTFTGGTGSGSVWLTSSNPEVANIDGTFTSGGNGRAELSLFQAGSFTLTPEKLGDGTYAIQTAPASPMVTVKEAAPTEILTHTGGSAAGEPVNATARVMRRGDGETPKGEVQFYLQGKKLGAPLPLVDAGNGVATVTLNDIPLVSTGREVLTAVFLGESGRYMSVSASESWFVEIGDCLVEELLTH